MRKNIAKTLIIKEIYEDFMTHLPSKIVVIISILLALIVFAGTYINELFYDTPFFVAFDKTVSSDFKEFMLQGKMSNERMARNYKAFKEDKNDKKIELFFKNIRIINSDNANIKDLIKQNKLNFYIVSEYEQGIEKISIKTDLGKDKNNYYSSVFKSIINYYVQYTLYLVNGEKYNLFFDSFHKISKKQGEIINTDKLSKSQIADMYVLLCFGLICNIVLLRFFFMGKSFSSASAEFEFSLPISKLELFKGKMFLVFTFIISSTCGFFILLGGIFGIKHTFKAAMSSPQIMEQLQPFGFDSVNKIKVIYENIDAVIPISFDGTWTSYIGLLVFILVLEIVLFAFSLLITFSLKSITKEFFLGMLILIMDTFCVYIIAKSSYILNTINCFSFIPGVNLVLILRHMLTETHISLITYIYIYIINIIFSIIIFYFALCFYNFEKRFLYHNLFFWKKGNRI